MAKTYNCPECGKVVTYPLNEHPMRILKKLGRSYFCNYECEKAFSERRAKEMKKKEFEQSFKNAQPCWTCKNCNTLTCSWIGNDKPVEGWEAVSTHIVTKGYEYESTKIIKCPNYEREVRR